MTINTWLLILTFTIGLGTSQAVATNSSTTEPNWIEKTDCYKNGTWYNPCPTDPEPSPPTEPTEVFDQP